MQNVQIAAKWDGVTELHKGKGTFVPVLFLTEHHATKAYWGVEV
jgi:hypothetical protein